MAGSMANFAACAFRYSASSGFGLGEGLARSVGQEFHPLPKSSPDHRIVRLKTKFQRLARVDFLLDVVVDEPPQLDGCRRPLPGPGEQSSDLLDLSLRDDDPLRRRRVRAIEDAIGNEDPSPSPRK